MDIYSTSVLVQVVPNLLLSQNWLLDKFFPNVVTADTEEVAIDVDIGKRRMSPFVSPLVEGKLVESRTYQTNSFKPAYIKDKRAPDLLKPVRRSIGERIAGSMSPGEREQANLKLEMADQIDMLNRRLEWMAASVIQAGSVTISGDGYPTTVVNFGRDAGLTVTLAGTAKWDSTGPDVQGNLQAWANAIMRLSGSVPTDIVFSDTAFKGFIADPTIKNAIIFDTARARDLTRNNVQTANQPVIGAMYKGHWGGYDLWIYNDWYVDDNNVQQRMLPDGSLFMSSPAMMGTRAFGMIKDPAFNYGAMAYAPKSWLVEDPAQRFLMMQSAPILIPARVNTTLFAQVATGILN